MIVSIALRRRPARLPDVAEQIHLFSAVGCLNGLGKIDRGVAVAERKRRSRGRIFFGWTVGRIDRGPGADRDLKVIGRSSSFRFKGKKEESKTIGEKLGVSTLLEGTVRKQARPCADRRRTDQCRRWPELWSRTFDRALKDIFAVQEEIAEAVADPWS